MKATKKILLITVLLIVASYWMIRINEKRDYFASTRDVFDYAAWFFEDTTTFATNYSEQKFLSIKPGMTTEEVKSILGDPLLKHGGTSPCPAEYWRYTQAPIDRHYWLRVVDFDASGKVIRICREYYVD